MKALAVLAPIGVVAMLFVGGCSDADADREPTSTEQAIIERLAESSSDDAAPGETEAARHEFIDQCMAEEGLEYLGPPESPSMLERLDLTEEDFRTEYGFGHSTTIDLARSYEDLTITEMKAYQAALKTLPEAERKRYQAREWECLELSSADFGLPENGTVNLPADSPINGYLDRALEATTNDPRLAEVTAHWSDCMRDRGYDFADRDEMGLPLQEEAQQFMTAYSIQGQRLVDSGRTWQDLSVAKVLDAEQLAALEELQQRELDIAAAHQSCIDQGHDIDAVYAEVYDEHLAEFAGS